MKISFLTLSLILFSTYLCLGQERKNSIGLTSDFQLESPSYNLYYGLQGKHDFNKRHAVQLQFGFSDANIGFVGADYLYNLFLLKENPLIYVGGGTAYEYMTKGKGNELSFNAQVGFQFKIGKIQPYIGYKSKFYFEAESFDPNFLTLGVRYRL
ncbi:MULTISPECIES: hypothetical protein [unclassified Sphingobacterium]|uniref:hypothetical protein n=1 Tax=unclassified Sphingobacterium TaxID=2609468 RepID=UPI0010433A7B|nr:MULTISPECIES: hypothetical protein [unclassified Sphingobacterium]MCS3557501.1 hypothetical protein [Sphingobacterium sp. JUb21]TCQ95887.1 hypothetical protein EDF66_1241 [Sphingobacterium sp. JUb20]